MIINQQLINNGLLPISIRPTGKYREAFRRYDKREDLSEMVYVLLKSEQESFDRVRSLGLKLYKDREKQKKEMKAYSKQVYNLLLRNAREIREIRKSLRSIEKQLAAAGYSEDELSADVINNIAFARANMKMNIYDQAVLEGVATSFPQTEEIIENGKVSGMTATDVQKILNLKHAWEFILDRDVVASRSDYYMLSHIARLVNEGFFAEGGRIRGVPVTIGGLSYIPPLPNEVDVKERIQKIVEEEDEAINIAIRLCLYCMKTQIFLDGNKRASVIFANHYLISHGGGFLVIPEKEVQEFKNLLVKYYEGEDISVIATFMKERCWKTIES